MYEIIGEKMIPICIGLIAAMTVIMYIYYKKVYNVAFLFSGFWLVIVLMSSLNLYDVFISNDYVYELITLGVAFFDFGFLVSQKIRIKNVFNINEEEIDQRKYLVCVCICLIAISPDLQMLLFFFENGFDINYIYYIVAMNSYGDTDSVVTQFGTAWQQILSTYIGYPLQYLLIASGICKGLKEGNKKYIFISLTFLIVRFLVDIKRTVLIMFFFMALFVILLLQDRKKTNSGFFCGVHKKNIIYFFVFLGIYILISNMRSGEEENFSLLENIYFYYAGCVKYFDLRIANIDFADNTYGLFSCRGLIAPFLGVLTKIMDVDFPIYEMATKQLALLHGTVYQIAPGHYYNSYATCFWEFYVDGKEIGVAIGSLIYGLLGGVFFHSYIERRTLLSIYNLSFFISIYLLFSMLQISSIINYLVWPLLFNVFMFERKDRNG